MIGLIICSHNNKHGINMSKHSEKQMAPEQESPLVAATPSTSAAEESGPETSTPMIDSKGHSGAEGENKAGKQSVQIRDSPVSDVRPDYQIVQIKEKHGQLYLAIPSMPIGISVICCLLNIVLPGTGTLMSAFSVFCCGATKIDKPCRAFGLSLAAALLQMITFVVIVGWIWSIRWGMTFVQLSLSSKEGKNVDQLPYYVRRQSSVNYEKQQSKHA